MPVPFHNITHFFYIVQTNINGRGGKGGGKKIPKEGGWGEWSEGPEIAALKSPIHCKSPSHPLALWTSCIQRDVYQPPPLHISCPYPSHHSIRLVVLQKSNHDVLCKESKAFEEERESDINCTQIVKTFTWRGKTEAPKINLDQNLDIQATQMSHRKMAAPILPPLLVILPRHADKCAHELCRQQLISGAPHKLEMESAALPPSGLAPWWTLSNAW